jgi:uncharacterized membrane protein YphA (DoxX/SURF4 family)
MAANREATGLAALRVCLGLFTLTEACEKWRWLLNAEDLSTKLSAWSSNANHWSAWYLQHVALPYVSIWARVVLLGEVVMGLALLFGVFTRPLAMLGVLFLLNFYVASGLIFHVDFLTSGLGLPLLGGMLALAIGAGRLPWSLRS